MKIKNFKNYIQKINLEEIAIIRKNLKFLGFITLGFILGVITTIEYPSLLGNNVIIDLENEEKPQDNDKLVGKGDNIEIYESELIDKLKSLDNSQNLSINDISFDTKKLLINEIAGKKIIFRNALKERIQDDKYIKEELNNFAQNLITAKYLDNFVKESVTEANIKSVYNQLVKELDGKYEMKISHILLDNEKDANNIFYKVRYNKKRFSKLAKEKSLDISTANKGGSLGYIIQGQMLKEFEDQIFSKDKNQILKPFQTKLGWHVVYIEDKRKAQAANFEVAKQNIENELAKNSIKSHALKLLEELNFDLI